MRVAQEWHDLADEEQKLIRTVVESVCRRVPDLDPGRAQEHVVAAWVEFRHARVRDFLPILVERAVLRRLVA